MSAWYKIISSVLVCVLTSLSVIGAPVHASPCARFHPEIPSQLHIQRIAGPMLLKMLHKSLSPKNSLHLSEAQQQQIAEQFHIFHQAVTEIRQEFRDLEQVVRTDNLPHGNNRINAGFETRRSMAKLRFRELYIRHMVAIFNILTPEQQAKLKTRSMAVLMLYLLSAEFKKLAPASRTEKLTIIQSVQNERVAEQLFLPEEIPCSLTIPEHLNVPQTLFLQSLNILRI